MRERCEREGVCSDDAVIYIDIVEECEFLRTDMQQIIIAGRGRRGGWRSGRTLKKMEQKTVRWTKRIVSACVRVRGGDAAARVCAQTMR